MKSMHHFDSKAEVEIYIRGLPIKSVFYMAGFYMQNFKNVFSPKLVRYSIDSCLGLDKK